MSEVFDYLERKNNNQMQILVKLIFGLVLLKKRLG